MDSDSYCPSNSEELEGILLGGRVLLDLRSELRSYLKRIKTELMGEVIVSREPSAMALAR